MPTALCAIDGIDTARRAARTVAVHCRERGTPLTFVGVVPTARLAASDHAVGDRILRLRRIQDALAQALREARAVGVEADVCLRAGDVEAEARRVADAVGASDLFLPHERGRLAAALTRRPRSELRHIALERKVIPIALRLAA
jgi:hypothetical protein